MENGSRLVLPGSIFGCTLLVSFLLLVTSGSSYPPVNTLIEKKDEQSQNRTEVVTKDVGNKPENNSRNSCNVSHLYPDEILQWCDVITFYADNNQLDPDLIAALVWQESGGNPVAYSKSGAVGLMQIMPRDGIASTFMCVNGPCFTNRPSIEELQNPNFNVEYGTRMLAGLINRKGNIRDALLSYGPMNVGYYYADKVLGIYDRYRAQ